MFFYRMYGWKLCSDIDFFQLVKEEDCKDCPCAGEIQICEDLDPEPLEQRKAEIGRGYEILENSGWLMNYTLWMKVENGNAIHYRRKEGANEIYLRTYILGFGMAMLAMQRGALAIHCSAISKNGKAVLIAGESGAGKSTVTKAFLENGYSLMADDMAVVTKAEDGVWVWPAYPFQKMCRDEVERAGFSPDEIYYIDEEKDKFMVPYKGEYSVNPVPLSGLLYLCKKASGDIEVQEVEGVQKFFLCANNLFLRRLLKEGKYAPYIGERCLWVAAAARMSCMIRSFRDSLPEKTAEKALAIVKSWED